MANKLPVLIDALSKVPITVAESAVRVARECSTLAVIAPVLTSTLFALINDVTTRFLAVSVPLEIKPLVAVIALEVENPPASIRLVI